MSYRIDFTKQARKAIAIWKKSNQKAFIKLSKLLEEIATHPRHGSGHPEALKGGNDNLYSRRITAQHRIVYEIHDLEIHVLVLDVEGHYSDK